MDKKLELQIKIAADQAFAQVKSLSGDLKSLTTQARLFSGDTGEVSKKLQQCEKAAASAAKTFNLFGASASEVRYQQQFAKKAAKELIDKGLEPESQEVQNLVKHYKELGEQAAEIDRANSSNVRSFGDLKTAVMQTAAAVALIKTVDKIKELSVFALSQADAFQTARNEFGILLGDMEAGAGLFNQIKAFNDKTPFDLNTTKQAVNVLLSADVPLTQINERLRQFGDLSQGNSQRFASYIDAFSKASAKGKVDMQVLNTYMNQGVPILKELAAGFNTTEAEIMDMVSKGQISFRDFTAALERLTAEGGKYFGGMELGSKSLAAMQEGLKESVNSLAASYGSMLLPVANKVLEIFTWLINALNESAVSKGLLAGAVVALTGYLTVMTVKQSALAVATWKAYAAKMGLNAALAVTNPALIAGIAAATAATVAVVAYASAQQKAADRTNDAALAAKVQSDAYQKAASSAREYAEALDGLGVTAQRGMLREAEYQVAQMYQEIDRIQKAMANTQRRVHGESFHMSFIDPGYGNNPEYDRLQRALEDANLNLTQAKANVVAIKDKMSELRESSIAAFGTEWQDKLLSGIEAMEREQVKAIAELRAKAYVNFKEDYANNRAYLSELEALREYYRRKRHELEKKDIKELGTVWQDRMISGIEAIEREYKQALNDLGAKASEIWGENFEKQAAYVTELAALQQFYENKKRSYERDTILQAHNMRMENYRKEWEYRRELARQEIERGDFRKSGNFIASQIMSQNSGSQLGEMFSAFGKGMGSAAEGAKSAGGAMQGAASNFSAAGAVWIQLLKALVDATMELENMKKIVNWANTAVDEAFKTIGPMLNEILAVFSDPLEEVGRVAGQLLAPFLGIVQIMAAFNRVLNSGLLLPLKMLGAAFEWFYNTVIYPVGNAFINMINGVIGLINKIPGVNIKKINNLNLIGEMAEEIAAEMERRKEEITRMYERQKDRVRDELSAQISSIRQQYELGLISRSDYEKQAENYQSAADLKLIDINYEMLDKLKSIAENTAAVLPTDQQKAVSNWAESGGASGLLQTAGALFSPTTTAITGTISAINEAANGNWGTAVGNVLTGGLWGGLKKIFKFDTGTPFVPRDMTAIIHQGEGIIPRTFNDGIRSGEYALIGRGNKNGKNEKSITVNLNVAGSVVTERELTSAIYRSIADGIEAGEFTPLPA